MKALSASKQASHWKQSGSTQRVPIFEDPHDGKFAADVGEVIVELFDFKRCDAENKTAHNGDWVGQDTIMCILEQLQTLPDAQLSLFRKFRPLITLLHNGVSFYHTITKEIVDPSEDLVIIVKDHDHNHYFSVLVETFQKQKAIHVFDSLMGRKDAEVKTLLASMFGSKAFDDYNFHNYTRHNFTLEPLQSGATCGPWSLWIAVAFMFDVSKCRRRRNDMHGRMRVKSVKMPNDDVVGFWKHLTYFRKSTTRSRRM
jgi:hypothetical protein